MKPTKKRSQQSIADECGVTRQTLINWRAQGIDISEGNLPALLEKAAAGQVRGELGRHIQEARLRKLTAEASAKEFELKILQEEYVTKESQLRRGIIIGQTIKSLVLKIPADIPQLIIGLDYAEAFQRCEDYAYSILEELAEADAG